MLFSLLIFADLFTFLLVIRSSEFSRSQCVICKLFFHRIFHCRLQNHSLFWFSPQRGVRNLLKTKNVTTICKHIGLLLSGHIAPLIMQRKLFKAKKTQWENSFFPKVFAITNTTKSHSNNHQMHYMFLDASISVFEVVLPAWCWL